MLHIAKKLIFALGVLTLVFAFYVSSFYLVRNTIIRPYESNKLFETHSVRPVYNVVYYPMRWFAANGSSFRRKIEEVHYGTLEEPPYAREHEPNMRTAHLTISSDTSMSIGFTGKKSVLNEFDEIEYGSYVKMVFGVALSKEYDRFINRLISVEVISLIEDPRIEEEDISTEESQEIFDKYEQLMGERKLCVDKFISDYQDLVFEHCEQAGYARNIGGGCHHVVGYSVTPTVMKKALERCPSER